MSDATGTVPGPETGHQGQAGTGASGTWPASGGGGPQDAGAAGTPPDPAPAAEAAEEAVAEEAFADEAFADEAGVPSTTGGLEEGDSSGEEAERFAPAAEAGQEASSAATADLPDEVLELVAKERDEFRDALQRLQADFENYRKRVAKLNDEIRERAAEHLVTALLPVLDTAELALTHGAGEDVKQLSAALFGVLEKEGLEKIDNAGEAFDPTRHDAVAHEPGEGDGGQEVAEVMRAGYRWRGRVLRPAMVKVRG